MMGIQYLSLRHCTENILRLTKRMLMSAQNEKWDGVTKLQIDREKALKGLFDHPDIEESLPLLSDILYKVLEIDRECIQLTENARFIMLQNIHRQSRGDYASRMYRINSTR